MEKENIVIIESKYKTKENISKFYEDYSIVFIKDGVHIFENDIAKYEVSKGTLKIQNPNKMYKTYNSSFEYANLIISKRYINLIAKKMNFYHKGTIEFSTIIKNPNTIKIFCDILLAYQKKESQRKINLLLNLFVKNLLENHIFDINIEQKEDMITKKINKYIYKNHDEKITLDTLEEHLGICKYQVIRKVKKNTGLSPIKYAYILKTNIAKQMVQNKEYKLSEIAYKCGFSDQSNLIKNFKKIYDNTPLIFRKNSLEVYH